MIMVHLNTENMFDAKMYSKGWVGRYAPTVGELASFITKYPCSSCLWGNGDRKKINFRGAHWLGLDFDDGMTIDEAKVAFKDYLHLMGTTKSHQILKDGERKDRFRVFLRFGVACKNVDNYEATVSKYIKKYGADSACKDAARMFWPCKEIVSSKFFGKIVTAVDASEILKRKIKAEDRKERNWKVLYKDGRSIPARVQTKLLYGAVDGKRNITCYGFGADLGSLGYSVDKILDLVVRSGKYISSDFTIEEARLAISSGMKKAKPL